MEQSKISHFPEIHSKTQYIISLAKELIDDIELSRLPVESLLLKTMRLARLAGSEKTQTWITYELAGYVTDDPISIEYMGFMGRWTDYEKKLGYWFPLAQVEANIATMKLRIQSLRVPDISYSPSNPNNFSFADQNTVTAPVHAVLRETATLTNNIAQMTAIKSRVIAHLYVFVVRVHHEKIFSGLTESIFERYKTKIDALLTERADEILKKIPAIYSRLVEGDMEAISHAQTSCRRMIDAFADAIYPPTDEVMQVNGRPVPLDKAAVRARINQYVCQKTQSKSRQDKLRQTLANLYNRVSTGVHNEVTLEEAQSLFLQTYLFLGEVLTLGQPPALTPVDNFAIPSQNTL